MKSLKFFGLLGTFFLVMQLIIVSLISAITISLTGKFTLESIIILCVVLSIFAAYNYKVRKRHLTDLGNLLRDFNSKKIQFQNDNNKSLYENIPIMLHSINTNGELISVSDYWLEKLGYTREEVIGRKSVDFLTEESKNYANQVVLPNYLKNGFCYDVEYKFVKKNGEQLNTLLSATCERDSQGKIIRSLAVIVDITERKKAEEKAKDIYSLLESIVDNIPSFIFVKRASDLRFVLFNRAAEKFLGKDRKDLIGKNDFEIFKRSQAIKLTKKDREVLEKPGEIDTHTEQINTKMGKRVLNAKKLALLNEKGEPMYLLGITEDVTEEKLAEAELKLAKEDAAAANIAKSQFLANMGHELRTPLNGVIGFSDLLLKTNLNETQIQYTRTIFRSANSLLQLLNDILSVSTLEENKLVLHIEKTNLIELINQSSDVIQFAAMEKNLKVIITILPETPDFIWVDPVRLKQVFLNLLSNAVKYTEAGEIEIKIETKSYNPQSKEVEILFAVRDTGIGISVDDYEKIFESFSQVDASYNRKYGGAGLGLAISKRLLALMQTNLEIKSEPNKGSTFYFTIKTTAEYSDSSRKISITENYERTNVALESKEFKVLIVDDDIINMFLAKTIIKNILPNAIIYEAENGKDAVEQFTKVSPDIIFMDIQMPEMDGYEATYEIRQLEIERKIPIIAVTAGMQEGNEQNYLKSGMDDYTSKPVIQNTLEQLIHKWLLSKHNNHFA
jgi:PAS domain S-box-containing protein